jgi:hypothetical protein
MYTFIGSSCILDVANIITLTVSEPLFEQVTVLSRSALREISGKFVLNVDSVAALSRSCGPHDSSVGREL